MDARAAAAKFHHLAAAKSGEEAEQHRKLRDDLIRKLYAEGGWSYATLAKAVHCSREMIAKVVQNR